MLTTLRDFFEKAVGSQPSDEDERSAVAVAAAVLLLEVARSDRDLSAVERDAALAAVRTKFGLSQQQAEDIIRTAEAEAREATSLYPFTSLINREFSATQKERLIELVWRVAYTDAGLDAHELHLVRRIANLLHIPHGTYIAAKMRAKEASGS
jgi:uncharacterized tellurite resistance protein B-like protein